jgi:hypothetical protein
MYSKRLIGATIERGNGAVLCMKEELMAFDSKNYIIPIMAYLMSGLMKGLSQQEIS